MNIFSHYKFYFEKKIKVVGVLEAGRVTKGGGIANSFNYWGYEMLKQRDFKNAVALALVTADPNSMFEALWFENERTYKAFRNIIEWTFPGIESNLAAQKHSVTGECVLFYKAMTPRIKRYRYAKGIRDVKMEYHRDNEYSPERGLKAIQIQWNPSLPTHMKNDLTTHTGEKNVSREIDIIKQYSGGQKVLLAPSAGFEHLDERGVDDVESFIRDEERNEFFRVCTALDETFAEETTKLKRAYDYKDAKVTHEQFNKSFKLIDYLVSEHKYKVRFEFDGCTYLKSPYTGFAWDLKWDGKFASAFSEEVGLKYRFRHTPAQVYTFFSHKGNYISAYSEMLRMGFGKPEELKKKDIPRADANEHKLWATRYYEKGNGIKIHGWKKCIGLTDDFAFYATTNFDGTCVKLDKVVAVRRKHTVAGAKRVKELNERLFGGS